MSSDKPRPNPAEEIREEDPVIRDLRFEVERWQGKARRADSHRKQAMADLIQSRKELDVALELRAAKKPRKIRPKREAKGKAVGVPVYCCSDWHPGERVDPKTVNGLNEYNPDIFRASARDLYEGFLWNTELLRNGYDITEGVFWWGGDLMSGYIHEELMESNYLSPTEEVLLCQETLIEETELFLARSKLSKLTIVCNFGNHGRINQKKKISTAARNSYEWLMYHSIARHFASDERIEFIIADGEFLYVDVLGWTIRFTHGDFCRYGGGVGGLLIPLNRKLLRLNRQQPAEVTVLGHFHTWMNHRDVVVNGSLIGYSPYSMHLGAEAEPPAQMMFLMDELRGKRYAVPIEVLNRGRRTKRR